MPVYRKADKRVRQGQKWVPIFHSFTCDDKNGRDEWVETLRSGINDSFGKDRPKKIRVYVK